ncbi:hypothetical protein [Sorangium sp. So ce1151]|uniref:hypothetical protein n=1 Tax=Sorangium sp. So ce1151 TaxID=3133332 RepID=UPI003F5E732C
MLARLEPDELERRGQWDIRAITTPTVSVVSGGSIRSIAPSLTPRVSGVTAMSIGVEASSVIQARRGREGRE